MKICRFRHNSAVLQGVLEGDRVFPVVGARGPAGLLENTDLKLLEPQPLNSVELLCPLEQVRNLYCCAGNYYQHVAESGWDKPAKETYSPRFFLKPQGVIIGPEGVLRIPDHSKDHIDWECELALVIGHEARRVKAADAEHYIAGYTVFNDFSNRKFCLNPQRTETSWDPFFDWLHGKWHDTFGAVGPVVATRDELPAVFTDTRLTLSVNGVMKQNSDLNDMIFSPAELVAFLSRVVTLQPGDLIATGTPGGVASAGAGPYLRAGDRVEASVTGIGVLPSVVEDEE